MRIYVGFDDTDNIDADRGTGKLARWFERELPEGCRIWGVVRQQLLVHEDIPYTSHNSSACAVVEVDDASLVEELVARAVNHIQRYALAWRTRDCAWPLTVRRTPPLVEFGRRCNDQIVTQKEALRLPPKSIFQYGGPTRASSGLPPPWA